MRLLVCKLIVEQVILYLGHFYDGGRGGGENGERNQLTVFLILPGLLL